MNTKIRHPYVAGKFYPDSAIGIMDQIKNMRLSAISTINYNFADRKIYGAILPHAGHIYSGYQTIHFFEILQHSQQVFDTFIILHPIHRCVAPEFAADASEKWMTPMGTVSLDLEFIAKSCLPVSTEQQKWEHSAEVILPFIQYFVNYNYKIVPIGISTQTLSIAMEISSCISNAVYLTGRKICIIASSDFTHYDTPENGRKMDQKVIDRIIEKDIEGIFYVIQQHNISVCGFGPIMTLVHYLNTIHKDLKISVLNKGNSGDIHPSSTVVDYVSMLFHN